MKHSSTLFLKAVVAFIGIAVLGFCAFLIYTLLTQKIGGYGPILVGMLVAAIPFFVGVFQTFKLLNYIDSNTAFSHRSIEALKIIKFCGAIISVLYGVGMPYIYIVAERDDAPGVILIGFIFTAAPMVVAVFAAVLQKLLQNAIDIKSENDLTV